MELEMLCASSLLVLIDKERIRYKNTKLEVTDSSSFRPFDYTPVKPACSHVIKRK